MTPVGLLYELNLAGTFLVVMDGVCYLHSRSDLNADLVEAVVAYKDELLDLLALENSWGFGGKPCNLRRELGRSLPPGVAALVIHTTPKRGYRLAPNVRVPGRSEVSLSYSKTTDKWVDQKSLPSKQSSVDDDEDNEDPDDNCDEDNDCEYDDRED